MLIGDAYKQVLSPAKRRALDEASRTLIETYMDDLCALDDPDWTPDNCFALTFLPPKYRHRYTPQFTRRFFACVLTVVWKLGQPEQMLLSCTAEELAAWAIIEEAKALYKGRGKDTAFDGLVDELFEDEDALLLYQGEFDGIEDSEDETVRSFGLANLAFKDWFKPFRPGEFPEVHPYAADPES